ncbi:Mth938-like domain-containing protein [Acidimangrovimonas sediminis]|uniref:Mth938-like domain-containing protein n=1 Tax=Acidimangrovimonas sediminis TaxID=2056283 RepID=UPI000C809759|nr:Mth938-like domain-containing protein [Acidimangrovimonas sediminis]
MRLNEVDFGNATPVDGYGPGFFRVGGELHHGAVLVRPGATTAWGGLEDAEALLALAGEIDVIFVGMGPEIAPLPGDLRRQIEAAGMGVEVMASHTAAHSYNVTLAEGRRVACALLPVGDPG